MERKTIIQEYLILTTNEKGKMPFINGAETKAGIVVAGFLDLLLANVIKIEDKKTEAAEKLPEELDFLNSLYEYLLEKKRSVTKVVEDYIISFTDTRLNQLMEDTGKSLVKAGIVSEEKGGLLGNKNVFIPKENYKEELINSLKMEFIQKEMLSLHDIVLATLLKETKNLKQYFSKYEINILKEKLKAMKDNPDSRVVKEMIGYIEAAMAAMIAAVTAAN